MWVMQNACFPSENLEFWYSLGRRLPRIPEKNLGKGNYLHKQTISHVLSKLNIAGIRCLLCDYTREKDPQAGFWFPLDFASCTIFFCWFAVYTFAVINQTLEFSYVFTPEHMSFLSKLPNLEVIFLLFGGGNFFFPVRMLY